MAVLLAVPPVLDGVVAAAGHLTRNVGPASASVFDQHRDLCTLIGRDGVVAQDRIQILGPAFSTLLGRAGSDGVRDANPMIRASVVDHVAQMRVFVGGPGSMSILGLLRPLVASL